MKHIFLPVASIFPLLILSACSSDDSIKPYDKEITEAFVKNCAADISMTRPLCACVVSEYEKNIPQSTLISYYKERMNGKGLPQEFIDAEVAAQASCFVQLNDGPVPEGQYPAQVVKTFLNECQSGLSEEVCGCLVDNLAAQLPLIDYLAANAQLNKTGVMPDSFAGVMADAGQKCGTVSEPPAGVATDDMPEGTDSTSAIESAPDDAATVELESADAVVRESTDSGAAEGEAAAAHEHQTH